MNEIRCREEGSAPTGYRSCASQTVIFQTRETSRHVGKIPRDHLRSFSIASVPRPSNECSILIVIHALTAMQARQSSKLIISTKTPFDALLLVPLDQAGIRNANRTKAMREITIPRQQRRPSEIGPSLLILCSFLLLSLPEFRGKDLPSLSRPPGPFWWRNERLTGRAS